MTTANVLAGMTVKHPWLKGTMRVEHARTLTMKRALWFAGLGMIEFPINDSRFSLVDERRA